MAAEPIGGAKRLSISADGKERERLSIRKNRPGALPSRLSSEPELSTPGPPPGHHRDRATQKTFPRP